MQPVNVGLLGLGTVGAGAVNLLERNGVEIARRAGREIRVVRAAVRTTSCTREGGGACVRERERQTDRGGGVTARARGSPGPAAGTAPARGRR